MNHIQNNHIQNNHINNKSNNFLSDDPELYMTIINFYNSIVIGIVTTSMIHDQFENEHEKNKFSLSISILVFCLCEMEYMGLL